jgi:hypothetical protein
MIEFPGAAAQRMSTPRQPAYADFARLMTVKKGQCPSLLEWKMREIKGLARK